MDRRVLAKLNDGCAQYLVTGQPPKTITVMVERNMVQNGPEGLFRSESTGFTWLKSQLDTSPRGAIFAFEGCRYVVEEVVSDDGYFVTAACMESR